MRPGPRRAPFGRLRGAAHRVGLGSASAALGSPRGPLLTRKAAPRAPRLRWDLRLPPPGFQPHPALGQGPCPHCRPGPYGVSPVVPGSPGPIRNGLLSTSAPSRDGGQQLLWSLGRCPTGSPPQPPGAAALLPTGCAVPRCPGPWSHEPPHWRHLPCWGVSHRKGLGGLRILPLCACHPTAGRRCRQRALACESGPSAWKTSLGKKGSIPAGSQCLPKPGLRGRDLSPGLVGPPLWRDTCTDPDPHCGWRRDLLSR